MNGINTYYYSRILKNKKYIRNLLMLFVGNDDEETITANIDSLAALFLIDQDNVDKELYNEKEMELISPILEAYFSEQNFTKTLNKNEANVFINLSLNKRLPNSINSTLATKFAEEYNNRCNNPLLLIDLNTFKEICLSIDE